MASRPRKYYASIFNVILKMEAAGFSETLLNIAASHPEDNILDTDRREVIRSQ
jgi:hypothetical protein